MAAAQSFRANPSFDTQEAILDLGTGEAIVSFLDAKGRPNVCERATILPPQSDMGAVDDEYRRRYVGQDPLFGKYEASVDSESAYEIINGIKTGDDAGDTPGEDCAGAGNAASDSADSAESAAAGTESTALSGDGAEAPEEKPKRKKTKTEEFIEQKNAEKEKEKAKAEKEKEAAPKKKPASEKKTAAKKKRKSTLLEKTGSAAANTVGREIGKSIVRGILGILKK